MYPKKSRKPNYAVCTAAYKTVLIGQQSRRSTSCNAHDHSLPLLGKQKYSCGWVLRTYSRRTHLRSQKGLQGNGFMLGAKRLGISSSIRLSSVVRPAGNIQRLLQSHQMRFAFLLFPFKPIYFPTRLGMTTDILLNSH